MTTLLLDQEQVTQILIGQLIAEGRINSPNEVTITYTTDFVARVKFERKTDDTD